MTENPVAEAPMPMPMAVRVREACRLTGIGRSKLYELIAAGDIEIIKVGTITLIPVASLTDFFHRQAAQRQAQFHTAEVLGTS